MSVAVAAKHRPRKHREHPEPPRLAPRVPGALPFVGHGPLLRREGALPLFRRLHEEYGDAYEVALGPWRSLVVSHPDAFERVMLSHKANFQKGSAYDPVREVLGASVLTLENQPWKQRRRLLQPHFHRRQLREMFAGMSAVVETYLTDLRRRMPDGGVIDIHREMVQLTLDVVFTALFGPDLMGIERASYEVLNNTLVVVDKRMNSIRLPLWIPTANNRLYTRTLRELDRVVYAVIEAARSQPNTEAATLLAMLLATVDEEQGTALTAKDVRDEVVTLYVAGHETTALLLTWMFALTGDRPDVFAALDAELEAEVSTALPSFDDIPKLAYLRQVIDEVLRMRPPTAMLSRNTVEDDNLIGYRVRAGDLVLLNLFDLHHHRDYWRQPERFDPERFSPSRSANRDNWCYTPFSAGPRICIGNTFALNEAALIIAGLVRAADWQLLPDQHIEPVSTGTIRPSAPVRVRVRWKD